MLNAKEICSAGKSISLPFVWAAGDVYSSRSCLIFFTPLERFSMKVINPWMEYESTGKKSFLTVDTLGLAPLNAQGGFEYNVTKAKTTGIGISLIKVTVNLLLFGLSTAARVLELHELTTLNSITVWRHRLLCPLRECSSWVYERWKQEARRKLHLLNCADQVNHFNEKPCTNGNHAYVRIRETRGSGKVLLGEAFNNWMNVVCNSRFSQTPEEIFLRKQFKQVFCF